MEQIRTISAPQSRIHVLDALRGFALLGVILSFIPQQEVTFRMLMSGVELSPAMLASMALKDIQSISFSGALALGFIILCQIKSVGRYLS